jgi:hypothetical protein
VRGQAHLVIDPFRLKTTVIRAGRYITISITTYIDVFTFLVVELWDRRSGLYFEADHTTASTRKNFVQRTCRQRESPRAFKCSLRVSNNFSKQIEYTVIRAQTRRSLYFY